MKEPKPRFKGRALTSVLVACSCLVLLLSGTVLFVSPPGRVANWSDWRMLGLTKHDWSGLHVLFALVFVVGVGFHVAFNIRPLVNYFKDRLTRRPALRREWIAALALCGVVYGGTRTELPPFSSVLALSERVKRSWEDPRAAAPIPHAELLSLRELCGKAEVPYDTAVDRLEARGLKGIRPEIIVAKLAETNALSPNRIYEFIRGTRGAGRAPGAIAAGEGHAKGGFGGGGGGAGRKTLVEYCASAGLDLKVALARLEAKGLKCAPEKTLREIALENGYDRPYEILGVLEAKD